MANEQLAVIMRSNIEQTIDSWVRAVRADLRIDSDSGLTQSQLRDHVPAMLEQICDLLVANETPDHTNTLEGRVTVFVRLQLGYRGRDLVREISLLRTILLDYLAGRSVDAAANIDLAAYHRVARIINLYLDEILRNAISVYSEAAPEEDSSSEMIS